MSRSGYMSAEETEKIERKTSNFPKMENRRRWYGETGREDLFFTAVEEGEVISNSSTGEEHCQGSIYLSQEEWWIAHHEATHSPAQAYKNEKKRRSSLFPADNYNFLLKIWQFLTGYASPEVHSETYFLERQRCGRELFLRRMLILLLDLNMRSER